MSKGYTWMIGLILSWTVIMTLIGAKHYEKMAELSMQNVDVSYKQDEITYAPEKEKRKFWGRTR